MSAATPLHVRLPITPELPWVAVARSKLGTREIPGPKSDAFIATLWRGVEWIHGRNADTDLAPWCGAFTRWCVNEANALHTGLMLPPPPPKWWSARSWDAWGVSLAVPTYGALLTFVRNGGGHVGWCVGRTDDDRLLVLGGNQGDGVSIAPFDRWRVARARWPFSSTRPALVDLPRLAANGVPSSHNEA